MIFLEFKKRERPMQNGTKNDSHFKRLKAAFDADGYSIERYIKESGRYGIRAAHREAVNYDTGQPKLAFYLEGTPYEMGYQMGRLAEEEVTMMTTTFVKNVPMDFVFPDLPDELKEKIGAVIMEILEPSVKKLAASDAIPEQYNDQINGILEGCQTMNPNTKVTLSGLQILNYGIDVISSLIYHGQFFEKKGILPSHFKIPMMCNAFSLSGNVVEGNHHYFGRDFMFVTGGVFQDAACLVIYNPDHSFNGIKALPSVIQTAPGMVGSISGVNINGVSMGVDISPSVACDPENPGLNSLLMVRHCVDYGKDAQAAVDRVKEAKRGVSWIYPFADGSTGKAGMVEAIKSININTVEKLAKYYHAFPLKKPTSFPFKIFLGPFISGLEKYLPDVNFIKTHMEQFDELKTGIFTRWSTYKYPTDYLDYNKGLWDYYNEIFWFLGIKKLHDDALTPEGFINRYIQGNETEKNCPSSYYFAPQREMSPDIVLATNHFLSPELRFTNMNYWSATLMNLSGLNDDIQWRYDELNHSIREALANGPVNKEKAIELIDFLNPKREKFPLYYAGNTRSKDGKEIVINGSVSLFDLKEKTIDSLFGYYSDKWVSITLPRYLY
jgi:hypothetical protein